MLSHVKRFGSGIRVLSQIAEGAAVQFEQFTLAAFPKDFPMKFDHRTLSDVRTASPFATPPRVLVMADDDDATGAVALAGALEALGADAEVRFASEVTRSSHQHAHPDAVVVAGTRGYRVTRHHPILEGVSRFTR